MPRQALGTVGCTQSAATKGEVRSAWRSLGARPHSRHHPHPGAVCGPNPALIPCPPHGRHLIWHLLLHFQSWLSCVGGKMRAGLLGWDGALGHPQARPQTLSCRGVVQSPPSRIPSFPTPAPLLLHCAGASPSTWLQTTPGIGGTVHIIGVSCLILNQRSRSDGALPRILVEFGEIRLGMNSSHIS